MANEEPMIAMDNTMLEVKESEEIKREDYATIWLQTMPTKEGGNWTFGSMHMTKMLLFLAKVKPTTEDIKYWLFTENFPLSRKEREDYEFYRLRRVFIEKLNKFRGKINGIIYMLDLQRFQAIQKEENLKNQIKQLSFQEQVNNK